MEHRRALALEAFKAGWSATGVQCPNCGRYHMRTVRQDAEENLFWSGAFVLIGIVSLIIVFIAGDTGLYVANLSTVALVAIVVGVLLYVVARRRRLPTAFECFDCGYRVP